MSLTNWGLRKSWKGERGKEGESNNRVLQKGLLEVWALLTKSCMWMCSGCDGGWCGCVVVWCCGWWCGPVLWVLKFVLSVMLMYWVCFGVVVVDQRAYVSVVNVDSTSGLCVWIGIIGYVFNKLMYLMLKCILNYVNVYLKLVESKGMAEIGSFNVLLFSLVRARESAGLFVVGGGALICKYLAI